MAFSLVGIPMRPAPRAAYFTRGFLDRFQALRSHIVRWTIRKIVSAGRARARILHPAGPLQPEFLRGRHANAGVADAGEDIEQDVAPNRASLPRIVDERNADEDQRAVVDAVERDGQRGILQDLRVT